MTYADIYAFESIIFCKYLTMKKSEYLTATLYCFCFFLNELYLSFKLGCAELLDDQKLDIELMGLSIYSIVLLIESTRIL